MARRVNDLAEDIRPEVTVAPRAMAGALYPPQTEDHYDRVVSLTRDASLVYAKSFFRPRRSFLVAKRVLDVVFSLIAIAFLAPVLTAIGIAIAATSKGPVLFRQQRVGLNNTPFTLYKFRSMYVDMQDVSGIAHTVERDPRVTRVGWFIRRTYLDELPQLLNVLTGDMSLVGPRAQVAGMRAVGMNYEELVPNYRTRHIVKPGITGLAQVRGFRGEIRDVAHAIARVDADLEYVSNAHLWLDLRILLLTVPSVILGRAKC